MERCGFCLWGNETEKERPFDKLVRRQFFKLDLFRLHVMMTQWPQFDRFFTFLDFDKRFLAIFKIKCLYYFLPGPDDETEAAATLREFERRKIKELDSVRTDHNHQISTTNKNQISTTNKNQI